MNEIRAVACVDVCAADNPEEPGRKPSSLLNRTE